VFLAVSAAALALAVVVAPAGGAAPDPAPAPMRSDRLTITPLEPSGRVKGTKASSSRLARTDDSLLGIESATPRDRRPAGDQPGGDGARRRPFQP
jgi:hypothetical protein